MRKITLPLLLMLATMMVLASNSARAEWQLNNAQSNINFISIKKGTVGEVHSFDQLYGSISPNGMIEITIDLTSVNTTIPIRDERMQDHLFETSTHPSVALTAKVDDAGFSAMQTGQRMDISMPANLNLHGQTKEISLDMTIVKLSPTTVLVVSKKPVLINAADFELTDGIAKLMELAKLPSIAQVVPVSFVITFDAAEN